MHDVAVANHPGTRVEFLIILSFVAASLVQAQAADGLAPDLRREIDAAIDLGQPGPAETYLKKVGQARERQGLRLRLFRTDASRMSRLTALLVLNRAWRQLPKCGSASGQ